MQLLTIVVGRGLFDLLTDLGNTAFDHSGITHAIDDGGVLFGDDDTLGTTQIFQSRFFQLHAHFFGDDSTASQYSDILQHGLATVTEARRLDGSHFHDTAHGVDHQSRQGFAFYVFSNNQQRLACFGNAFQHRQHLANVGHFLVNQQDERVVQFNGTCLLLVDEVGDR